jgi:hypothetical protein
MKNMKYRKINNLNDSLNKSSCKLQQFLNEFLKDTTNFEADVDAAVRYFKTVNKVKSTNTKFSTLITLLLNKLNVRFENEYKLNMNDLNKTD